LLLEFKDPQICKSTLLALNLEFDLCDDNSTELSFDSSLPESHSILENHSLKLTLRSLDGTLQHLFNKKEDLKLELKQTF